MNDGGEEAAQEAASPRGRTARSIYSTEQQNSSPTSHRQDTRVENAMAAPRFLAAMAKGIIWVPESLRDAIIDPSKAQIHPLAAIWLSGSCGAGF